MLALRKTLQNQPFFYRKTGKCLNYKFAADTKVFFPSPRMVLLTRTSKPINRTKEEEEKEMKKEI